MLGFVSELGLRGLIKTIWFNCRYLPLREAFYLPFFIAGKVQVRNCHRGFCEFRGKPYFGMFRFGIQKSLNSWYKPSMLNIMGKIVLSEKAWCRFDSGLSLLVYKDAELEIDGLFYVGHDSSMEISKKLKIGDDNMWSFYNIVIDSDGHPIYDSAGNRLNPPKEIVFGDHVWMGCRCTVMKGSVVPSGSIIASDTLLTGGLEQRDSIYSDVREKRIIRSGIKWNRNED